MPEFDSYERIVNFINEMDPGWGCERMGRGIQAQLDAFKGPEAELGKHHDHAACEGLIAEVGL